VVHVESPLTDPSSLPAVVVVAGAHRRTIDWRWGAVDEEEGLLLLRLLGGGGGEHQHPVQPHPSPSTSQCALSVPWLPDSVYEIEGCN
jgi:hypothetical protein